jgi:hypothetical protein
MLRIKRRIESNSHGENVLPVLLVGHKALRLTAGTSRPGDIVPDDGNSADQCRRGIAPQPIDATTSWDEAASWHGVQMSDRLRRRKLACPVCR